MTVLISFVLALALAVACSSAEPPDEIAEEMEGVFVPADETPSDLAMYRGGPARTGVYDTEGVLETPEVKWVFHSDRAIASSAVVMDDKVLFGSDDGNFYALDAETGTTVWTFETGRQVRTSPLVADGVVYFGADDLFMSAVNIDDGEEVWRNKVEGTMRSSPVIVRGTLFFGTDSGVLYAYDARTGTAELGDHPNINKAPGPVVTSGDWRHHLCCQYEIGAVQKQLVRAGPIVRGRGVELSNGRVG